MMPKYTQDVVLDYCPPVPLFHHRSLCMSTTLVVRKALNQRDVSLTLLKILRSLLVPPLISQSSRQSTDLAAVEVCRRQKC
jgi:hypothetical protein